MKKLVLLTLTVLAFAGSIFAQKPIRISQLTGRQQTQCQLRTEQLPALFEGVRLGMVLNEVAQVIPGFSYTDLKPELTQHPLGVSPVGIDVELLNLGEKSYTILRPTQTAKLFFYGDKLYNIKIKQAERFDIKSVSLLISADLSSWFSDTLDWDWSLDCPNFEISVANGVLDEEDGRITDSEIDFLDRERADLILSLLRQKYCDERLDAYVYGNYTAYRKTMKKRLCEEVHRDSQ